MSKEHKTRKPRLLIIISLVCAAILLSIILLNAFCVSYGEGAVWNGYIRIDEISVVTVTYLTGETKQFLRVDLSGENKTDEDLYYDNFFWTSAHQEGDGLKNIQGYDLKHMAGYGLESSPARMVYEANKEFQQIINFSLEYGPGKIKILVQDSVFPLMKIYLNVIFDGDDVTVLEK